jgi:hypothetical protein
VSTAFYNNAITAATPAKNELVLSFFPRAAPAVTTGLSVPAVAVGVLDGPALFPPSVDTGTNTSTRSDGLGPIGLEVP